MNGAQRKMIEELYFELFDFLLAYARSSLENDALAEEAVQETFRIACDRPESVCSSSNPKGWLVNTLKNVIRNLERRKTVDRKLLSDYLWEWAEVKASSLERIDPELLYGNVADSEEFRLIKQIAMDGRSMIELAEERGITVNACKKRAQRAREILQRRIK